MRHALAIAIAALLGLVAAPALSQSGQLPGGARLEPTIADAGSAYYRFERLTVTSEDGARAYRVWIATPRKAAPASGYPVAWLLDGDAALSRIDEALLARLNAGDPPVIVAIGYEGDRQFNVLARALDYTPPPANGGFVADPAGRPGGGADASLTLLNDRIAPEISRRAQLDPARSLLWGHSYGGLCVLHAALTRPDAYHAFVAASPSIWWNYGSVLQEVDPFLVAPRPEDMSLTVLVGTDEGVAGSGRHAAHPMWTSVPRTAARDLAVRLSNSGLDVRYAELPGQNHGGMLAASLMPTLLSLAGVEAAIGVDPA